MSNPKSTEGAIRQEMITVGTCIRLSKKTNSTFGDKMAIATTILTLMPADESLLPELSVWVICRDITSPLRMALPRDKVRALRNADDDWHDEELKPEQIIHRRRTAGPAYLSRRTIPAPARTDTTKAVLSLLARGTESS